MKLVIAIYDSGVHPDMMQMLQEHGIERYTLLTGASGAGATGVRAGSPVWPGVNNILLLALPEEKVQPLIERAHQMRDSFPLTPGIRFIVTEAEIV